MMNGKTNEQLLEELAAPFKPQDIEWRVQSATRGQNGTKVLILPYIEARAVMERLDQVCGVYWQSHFDKIEVGGKEAFQCRLSIKIGDEWITRTDAAEVSDIESVKGGHSNALKRCGVQWGIGRMLYDLPQYWVELKERGEHRVYGNFKIKGKMELITGYFDTPRLPEWALSAANVQKIDMLKRNSLDQTERQQDQNQMPSQQQQKNNATPDELKQAEALTFVKQQLQTLETPLKFVAPLLRKSSGSTVNYEKAKADDLRKLYKALLPVVTYVTNCRSLGLSEEQMLYYAQITLNEGLESIHSLYFKMTKHLAEETLELIRSEKSEQAV